MLLCQPRIQKLTTNHAVKIIPYPNHFVRRYTSRPLNMFTLIHRNYRKTQMNLTLFSTLQGAHDTNELTDL